MKGAKVLLTIQDINTKIYTIRNIKVMLDSDLAQLYEVETKTLNRVVKRNLKRFPVDFMFQLSDDELENLRCQIGTFNHSLKIASAEYWSNILSDI